MECVQWMTLIWLKNLWDKFDQFDVMVEFNDIPLELPRCGYKWMMKDFSRCGFSEEELRRLNIFRVHMQALFLSDILSASGKILDGKYLVRRKTDEKWSKFNSPKEQSPNKDFTLWKTAIRQVVTSVGIMYRLGNLTQYGHKIWNWGHDEDNSRLLHDIEGVMNIYKETQIYWHRNTMNCCTQVSTNKPAEINGNICSVREVALALVAITSTATPPCLQEIPTCFLDVLIEWGITWLWDSIWLGGEYDWLEDAIHDGTCLAVTDGLYVKELYPDVCSAEFVLERSKG